MKDNNQFESDLNRITQQKEETDKTLLKLEIMIAILGLLFLFLLLIVVSFVEMQLWLRIIVIASGIIFTFVSFLISLKLEQIAGFYECPKCHHKHVPTYKQVNFAMHMGRTRYLKCPQCGMKSWNKKVISEKK